MYVFGLPKGITIVVVINHNHNSYNPKEVFCGKTLCDLKINHQKLNNIFIKGGDGIEHIIAYETYYKFINSIDVLCCKNLSKGKFIISEMMCLISQYVYPNYLISFQM